MWGQFMKLWIFLDVSFNRYKVEVIFATQILMWKTMKKQITLKEHGVAWV
jgi:hypothetical protein